MPDPGTASLADATYKMKLRWAFYFTKVGYLVPVIMKDQSTTTGHITSGQKKGAFLKQDDFPLKVLLE